MRRQNGMRDVPEMVIFVLGQFESPGKKKNMWNWLLSGAAAVRRPR
jgi:hypothetical protein